MNVLNGYKTYIAAAGLTVFAVLGLIYGKLSGVEAGTLVIEAIAIAGLRHGIAK